MLRRKDDKERYEGRKELINKKYNSTGKRERKRERNKGEAVKRK